MDERIRNRLLWGDVGVTVFALLCFWGALKEAERWLSFAGFGALFMILVYETCIGLLFLSGVFLALSIRRGRRSFLLAASVCQGLVALGWFRLWTAIPSLWSWTETGCAALGAAAVMGLLGARGLFPRKKKGESEKSGLYTTPTDDI